VAVLGSPWFRVQEGQEIHFSYVGKIERHWTHNMADAAARQLQYEYKAVSCLQMC
jgi:hypothetical protein